MKIGRNDACPCGSGLKYKKCCLLKENKESQIEDTSKGILGLHSYILERKDYFKKYLKIRKIHMEILDKMISDLDNGKFPFEIDCFLSDANEVMGEKINFNKLKKVIYDDMYLYYSLYMFGKYDSVKSLASRYLENKRYSEAAKVKILKAMENAYTGLFKINKVDASAGYVYLEDVINGKEFIVVDGSMSINDSVVGKIYIYSRLMTIDGITFNNCALPINVECKKIQKYIDNCKNREYHEIASSICLMNIFSGRDNKVSFRFN